MTLQAQCAVVPVAGADAAAERRAEALRLWRECDGMSHVRVYPSGRVPTLHPPPVTSTTAKDRYRVVYAAVEDTENVDAAFDCAHCQPGVA